MRMALKKCKECGHEISDTARRCPECGGYVWSSGRIGCALAVLFFFAFFIVALISTANNDKETTPNKPEQEILDPNIYSFSNGSYKITWKQGIILGILVPSNTTPSQLKDLIFKFKKAKKDQTLSSMIPPVNLGLEDKYTTFIIYVFSDPKWSSTTEYGMYERSDAGSRMEKAFLNHVVASYTYELDGKEYGAIGVEACGFRNKYYQKLF
jgi:hypothetical protein